jgi:hypothetical protein
VLAFVLRNLFFVNTAVIWALFLTAPLTPLFDRVFAADRFTWVAATEPTEELPVLS